MREFGLALIVLVLFILWQTNFAPVQGLPPQQQQVVPAQVQVAPPQRSSTGNTSGQTRSSGIDAETVSSWCRSNCDHHRWVEIQEGPHTAVWMTTGIASEIAVPEGISVDGWNCFANDDAVGPVNWTGCEATFRQV